MRKIAHFMISLIVLISLLAACGRTQEKYQINPAKISGDTVEQKLESFESLLNKKTEGFSKIRFSHESGAEILYSFLTVYSDEKVAELEMLPEDDGVGMAVVVSDNLSSVLGQIFFHTAGFISTDISFAVVYMSDLDGNKFGFAMAKSGLEQLKNASPEDWKKFLDTAVYFDTYPYMEVIVK